MRENSGKGDSRSGHMDPTVKEREVSKGRSGQASLKPKRSGGHKRTPSPDNRGGGGR
jgi:hypothetical protein